MLFLFMVSSTHGQGKPKDGRKSVEKAPVVAPAASGTPPAEQPPAPQCPPDRGKRCLELGKLVGFSYYGMPEGLRARTQMFDAFCLGVVDPALGRIPSEQDVSRLAKDLDVHMRTRVEKPYLNTEGLNRQVRDDNAKEQQMLEELLKR